MEYCGHKDELKEDSYLRKSRSIGTTTQKSPVYEDIHVSTRCAGGTATFCSL